MIVTGSPEGPKSIVRIDRGQAGGRGSIASDPWRLLFRYIQETGRREAKAAFCNVQASDLACKLIQPSEQIGVNLLQAFDGADLYGAERGTVEKGVCLGFALSIDRFIAVCDPFDKAVGPLAREVFGKLCDSGIIKGIREVFFPVRGRQFQLVSGANQLAIFFFQFRLQIFPVRPVFLVIVLAA